MKLKIYYLSTSSEGEDIAEETIQIEIELDLKIENNIENQGLFNLLNKFGWDNEIKITSLVIDKIGEIPNRDEFHSRYYVIGADNYNVELSQDFFDYGDNSTMYFNL